MRPTIYYDPNCNKPIIDAVNTLDDMSTAGDIGSINEVLWILACDWFSINLIYHTINVIVAAKRDKCRCCNNTGCYHANRIIFASLNVGFAISVLSLASISMGLNVPKFDSIIEWSSYSDCVSSYEQIT